MAREPSLCEKAARGSPLSVGPMEALREVPRPGGGLRCKTVSGTRTDRGTQCRAQEKRLALAEDKPRAWVGVWFSSTSLSRTLRSLLSLELGPISGTEAG